jgi:hypothetical protein
MSNCKKWAKKLNSQDGFLSYQQDAQPIQPIRQHFFAQSWTASNIKSNSLHFLQFPHQYCPSSNRPEKRCQMLVHKTF